MGMWYYPVIWTITLPFWQGYGSFCLRQSYDSIFFRKLDEPLYSLRCQIEILFKTWKSFFEIDECKNIKRKRLEYHLYGQLIGILLCSSTMFQCDNFCLKNKAGAEWILRFNIFDTHNLTYIKPKVACYIIRHNNINNTIFSFRK